MCRNISAFAKSNEKDSVSNIQIAKKSGKACITSLRLSIPGFKQRGLYIDASHVTIHLSGVGKRFACPYCGQITWHVHSYYLRHIQDVELFNMSTSLIVRARRFRCKHCVRTFSEPLSGITSRYGRKSHEVLDRIHSVSLKTTSRIASYLLGLQHIRSSASTCLRSIDRSRPLSNATIIGIDDAARKKGHTYMSVIVDQHKHQAVALLNSRSGEELDNYLLENQQVQFVTGDGSLTYADAIRRCLPHAIQISDKFHLIKHMVDTLSEEFSRLACTSSRQQKKVYSFPTVEECKAGMMNDFWELGDQRHREKLQFFIEADNAYREGQSFYQIAQAYGMHTEKVRRLLFKHTRKDYMSDEQKLLHPCIDALAVEFSRGCCKVSQLVERMDNRLPASAIKRVSQTLRNDINRQQRDVKKENSNMTKRKKQNHIFPKTIRNFILTGHSKSQELAKLLRCKGSKQAIELAQEFRGILNGKVVGDLEEWIKRAEEADSEAIKSFAKYIKSDRKAVKAAIDYSWNNALLEGTVNKLKTIKRQMYNRAGTGLLLAKMNGFKT